MEKISKMENDEGLKQCHFFEAKRQKDIIAENPTYCEILKIFREAFSLIDINNIIKKVSGKK